MEVRISDIEERLAIQSVELDEWWDSKYGNLWVPTNEAIERWLETEFGPRSDQN